MSTPITILEHATRPTRAGHEILADNHQCIAPGGLGQLEWCCLRAKPDPRSHCALYFTLQCLSCFPFPRSFSLTPSRRIFFSHISSVRIRYPPLKIPAQQATRPTSAQDDNQPTLDLVSSLPLRPGCPKSTPRNANTTNLQTKSRSTVSAPTHLFCSHHSLRPR